MVIQEIKDFSLSRIADSGQCFRMNRLDSGAYRIIAFEKYLEARELGDGKFEFSCSADDFRDIWTDYFDLAADYGMLRARIPQSDAFLCAAAEYGWGMRILQQDPWEMTVSFIISQRKSIPAIKTAIEAICTNFGRKLSEGGKQYYTFPSAQRIADLSCSDIGCCSLGYRDKYVTAAALSTVSGMIDFAHLKNTDEASAKAVLKSQYGIGEKVANCILLFGLHHTNAFPEDTWIKRIIDSEYGGEFPRKRHDGYLGIIQQYMFYYGRSKEYKIAAPLNVLSRPMESV